METQELTDLVENLDAETILAKLQDLDRQERALRVLLRAAREKQRRLPEQARIQTHKKGGA
jgi:hypothetical protein